MNWGLTQRVAVHAGGSGPPLRLASSGSMGSAASIGSESLFLTEGPRQSSLGTALAAMQLRELELQHHNLRSQQQQQQQQQLLLHEQSMLRGASMPAPSLEAKSPRAISCARQVSCGHDAGRSLAICVVSHVSGSCVFATMGLMRHMI